MKTNPIAKSRASLALVTLLLLCFSSPSLRAEVFGLFTYRVVGGATVEITDYPDNATGPVVIPAQIDGKPVTSIGYNAFASCTGLTSVTIPASVTSINYFGVFGGCTGLTSIAVDPLNPSYVGLDGVLFNKPLTTLITYPQGKAGSYTIPNSVTSVGFDAFSGCVRLTGITIPNSVTTISGWAFRECYGLNSVTIPNSVTSIGRGAFYYCFGLTSVTIPNSVTSIGNHAFAFCSGLTSVTIPSSVTSIGGENVDDNYVGAFSNCSGLTSVTFEQGLTTIGLGMFSWCPSLTSVTIPSSVTTIGDGAFYGSGLTNVVISAGVTAIGNSTFEGCSFLSNITIPSSVTSIGHLAFTYSGLTSVTIPSRVTTIGDGAFYGSSSLTRAVFLGNAPSLGVDVFDAAAPGFTIYYLSGSTGFTSQPGTWYGYTTTMINEATWPAASWLLTHGFWYDTNLQQDPNGDGVSLLMAYALDLNPHLSLPGSLPQPVLGAGTLSLSFHATSPGITYTVETSTNLQSWTTFGVMLSAPGPDGRATATVLRDSPSRFLRLVVAR